MKSKYNLLTLLLISVILVSGCISNSSKTPSSSASTEEPLSGWLFKLGENGALFISYNDQTGETKTYSKNELQERLGFDTLPSEKPLISFNQARDIAIKEKKTTSSDEKFYDYGVFCYKHSKDSVERSKYTENFWIFPIIRNVDSKTHVTGWMTVSDYFKTSKAVYDGATIAPMSLLTEHFGGSKSALVPLAKVMKHLEDNNSNDTVKDQLCIIYDTGAN